MSSFNVLDAIGSWTAHSGPLYRRLATAIQAAIARDDLPPGTVLPPERELSRQLSVGRSTVVAAYDLLRADGLIVSRRGSGTWVAGAERGSSKAPPRESLRGAALDSETTVLDLATASMPAAPLLRDAIAEMNGELLERLLTRVGYSSLGLLELRRAVADRLSLDGLPTAPEQVLITTGGQQALALITEYSLGQALGGDYAVVEDPTSPGVLDLLRSRTVTVRSAQSFSGYGAAPLLESVGRSAPSVVYIYGSLGPEGRQPRAAEAHRLISGLRGFSGVLVDDSSSRPLVFGEPSPYLAALTKEITVMTVGSMSKVFWGGLRVGWIRGDENVIGRLARLKARADLGTPLLSQMVSAWLLPHLPEVAAQRVADLHANLDLAEAAVSAELPEFAWSRPDGGVSMWLHMPWGASGPFTELARRHGVAVVPGTLLSPGGHSDASIRLSLTAPPAVLEQGVRRLASAWAEYSRGSSPVNLQ